MIKNNLFIIFIINNYYLKKLKILPEYKYFNENIKSYFKFINYNYIFKSKLTVNILKLKIFI